MSVDVPALPDPPPQRTRRPDLVERFADDLVAAGSIVSDVADFASGAVSTDSWSGSAASAYATSLRSRVPDLHGMTGALRFVAHACDEHAAVLRRLQRIDRDLLDRHTGLREQRAGIVRDLGRATDPGALQELRSRASGLGAAILAWRGDLDGLLRAERSAEDVMAGSFELAASPERIVAAFSGPRDPGDLALLPGNPLLDPFAGDDDRRRWWQGLTELQQLAIVTAHPGLVVLRGGLPARVRDLANRTLLRRDLIRLRGLDRLDGKQRRRLRQLEKIEAALDRGGRRDPRTGVEVPVQLWLYDPDAHDGDGRVAISIGDLDTAPDIAVQVPGFGTDAGSIEELTDRMEDLYDAAAGADDAQEAPATMIWIGYDAPDNQPFDGPGIDAVGVVGDGLAAAGGDQLSQDLEDLLGSRGDDPQVTVIGHSYGSTTVSMGAAGPGLDGADDVVLLGSPGAGSGVDSAADLGTDPGHVWVASDSLDPIAHLGDDGWITPGDLLDVAGLGVNPVGEEFDGVRFGAENPQLGPAPHLGHHTAYFTPGTEALDNLAEVVAGDHDDVEVVEPVRDPLFGPAHDPERP